MKKFAELDDKMLVSTQGGAIKTSVPKWIPKGPFPPTKLPWPRKW